MGGDQDLNPGHTVTSYERQVLKILRVINRK